MNTRTRHYCCYCGQPLALTAEGVPGCPRCEVTFYDNPTPAVAALAYSSEGRLLLVERDRPPRAGTWALPGGFIEIHESPADALRRELAEETGLKAGTLRLVDVADETSRMYGRVIVICYRVLDYTGIAQAGDDARALDFFDRLTLPSIGFRCHRHFIDLDRENYPQ